MQKKVLIVLAITIVCLIGVELGSTLILKYNSKLQFSFPYFNREISGFYIFKNVSGYRHKTIKTNSEEKDILIDEYDFITKNKINKTKSQNTIRIFITGGSAAFGSGQAKPYDQIKKYPSGIYSYLSSIAGKILLELDNKYPNNKFEIINACASGRKLNQTIALYLEKIKDFDPDIIISIDGNNDIETIAGISPYQIDQEIVLKKYIEILNISESFKNESFLNTINLFKQIKFYLFKQKMEDALNKNSDKLFDYNPEEYTKERYSNLKNDFKQNCETFTDLILYYKAICNVNHTELIFCLQPMLYREMNKTLTANEIKMKNSINPINISISNPDMEIEKLKLYENNGNILIKYFFDDYLSQNIDSIASINKINFVDLNKSIANQYEDTEFYVDYCHLTADANLIIAKILSEKISEILEEKKLIETE
ncbi:MAG: hypothetical protein PHP52_07815 [Bacteroidales bacterium]|nr:hypothetical protein [Bacteroidales bacterium]